MSNVVDMLAYLEKKLDKIDVNNHDMNHLNNTNKLVDRVIKLRSHYLNVNLGGLND